MAIWCAYYYTSIGTHFFFSRRILFQQHTAQTKKKPSIKKDDDLTRSQWRSAVPHLVLHALKQCSTHRVVTTQWLFSSSPIQNGMASGELEARIWPCFMAELVWWHYAQAHLECIQAILQSLDGSSVPLFRYTTSLRVLWAPSAHGLLSDVIGPDWLRYAQMVLVFKAQPMQKLCT